MTVVLVLEPLQISVYTTGPIGFIGTCYASNFAGDGSQITNLNVDQTGWDPVTGGIYNSNLNNVGIGTSVPRFNLELGPIGSEDISLHVNGKSRFIGFVETNIVVGGALTVTGAFNFGNVESGNIQSSSIAIGTSEPSQPLQVGTGTTQIFVVDSLGSVGIASTQPQTNLDINGTTRFKSYSERVKQLSIVANAVAINLSDANSFTCVATSDINEFVLTNIPSESASFTIKIDQDSIGGRTISIDVFKDNTGTPIPIY